jgi:tripartite ATP-independent transporter DctM subunit
MPATFGLLFLILMAVGVLVAFALSAAPIVGFILAEKWAFLNIVPQKLISGINQFPLLAIPLFILAGEVMNAGGVTSRLVSVASVFVGHFRAGIAQVNIASSLLFAGLSGSAVADTSALGSMLIPAMEKEGYTRRFSAAVTAASSIIGPIIPPSIMMVIYAYMIQVSVGALFLAGLVPGVLMGVLLIVMTRLLAERKNLPPSKPRATPTERLHAMRDGFFAAYVPGYCAGRHRRRRLYTNRSCCRRPCLYAGDFSLRPENLAPI